jgi:outer membrane protein
MKNNWLKFALGIALTSAFVVPAVAQELKIGVVSLQAIVERAPQTRAVMDQLREEFAPREREIFAKQKEIEDLQTKVQKDLAVMGETERRNAEKRLRELNRDFTRMRSEYQEESNVRRNEEFTVLQRSILKQVQDYAQQSGYDMIVGDGFLYASSAINITEDVLRAVEVNYKATE